MVAVRRHILLGSVLLLAGGGCAQLGVHAAPSGPDRLQAERCNAQGLALVEQGQFEQAAEQFRKALAADPFFGPAHCNLGVVLLHEGRVYDACFQLDAAKRLMPKASAPRSNLGLLYDAVGRYGEAEQELRAALELAPEDIEIIGHLARLQVRQKRGSPELLSWLSTLASHDDDTAWREWAQAQLVHVQSSSFTSSRDSSTEGK